MSNATYLVTRDQLLALVKAGWRDSGEGHNDEYTNMEDDRLEEQFEDTLSDCIIELNLNPIAEEKI